jgi:hypothetical protein
MNILADVERLRDEVTVQTGVMQSAATLLTRISVQMKAGLSAASAAGATPEQLASLSMLDATLQDQTTALAAAVAANTPAMTPMPMEPVEPITEPEPPPVAALPAPEPEHPAGEHPTEG